VVTSGSTWTRRGQRPEEDSGDVIRVDGGGAFRWSSLDEKARLRKRTMRESKTDIVDKLTQWGGALARLEGLPKEEEDGVLL
jgi:hypothetical protein